MRLLLQFIALLLVVGGFTATLKHEITGVPVMIIGGCMWIIVYGLPIKQKRLNTKK